ncbi:MAG: hypothetical protein ACKOCN_08815 [Planctomycetaceae bacterium]
MTVRHFGVFAGLSMAAALTGCTIPANSPFTGLAQLRPVATPHTNVLPPAAMLHHPGPGVDGPGPGVINPASYDVALVDATGGGGGAGGPIGADGMPIATSQISFISPTGMQVRWDIAVPGTFDSDPLIAPGRYDFAQGAIYRLKLTDIPEHEGLELYPTLEVGPAMPRTDAYLDHNAIPFNLTSEDFDQVVSGNFVTKVVYLPDAEYQELAVAGVEELVSTRLDPGVDPVVEADRRGSILAIIRIGNKDLQSAAGTGLAAGNGSAGTATPLGFAAPLGMPCQGDPSQLPPAFMAGATAPHYGMPITGTPIGLPGPAHIPLGVPAGLRKHTITNHTKMYIPPPSSSVGLHVQQLPGLSYPKPARHAYISERADVPKLHFGQPHDDKRWMMNNGGPDEPWIEAVCPPEGPVHE